MLIGDLVCSWPCSLPLNLQPNFNETNCLRLIFGFLYQVYLSDRFDANDGTTTFFSDYPEIMEIPGDAKSVDETYDVHTVRCGRFVIFMKNKEQCFEATTIEVLAIKLINWLIRIKVFYFILLWFSWLNFTLPIIKLFYKKKFL